MVHAEALVEPLVDTARSIETNSRECNLRVDRVRVRRGVLIEGGGSVEHQKYTLLEIGSRILVRGWRLGVYVMALSCLKLTPDFYYGPWELCEWSCGFGRVGGVLEISPKKPL